MFERTLSLSTQRFVGCHLNHAQAVCFLPPVVHLFLLIPFLHPNSTLVRNPKTRLAAHAKIPSNGYVFQSYAATPVRAVSNKNQPSAAPGRSSSPTNSPVAISFAFRIGHESQSLPLLPMPDCLREVRRSCPSGCTYSHRVGDVFETLARERFHAVSPRGPKEGKNGLRSVPYFVPTLIRHELRRLGKTALPYFRA